VEKANKQQNELVSWAGKVNYYSKEVKDEQEN
jgi:hypothetical protein